MNWAIIALLLFGGLIFLILEIIVIPGSTIVGVLGFSMLVFGIVEAYIVYGNLAGNITLAITLLLSFVAVYYTLKSKTWKRAMLTDKITSKVNLIDSKLKPGDTGRTISRLATTGTAEFNGDFMEVHSLGTFIDHEKDIVIVKIEGNKIFVKLKNT